MDLRYISEYGSLLSSARGLAADETLNTTVVENNSPPILHLYNFKPSVIVGKYQDLHSVVNIEKCKEFGVEYNRRHTGGGTVFMNQDVIALGFGISLDFPEISKSISKVFQITSEILIKALDKLGIKAKFKPKNDIEINGKKIAGLSATVEENNSLLFHASILVDFDLELMLELLNLPTEKLSDKGYGCFSRRMTTINQEVNSKVEMKDIMDIIADSFSKRLGLKLNDDSFSNWELKKIKELEHSKYLSHDWIFSSKYSKRSMGKSLRKTKGGLLEVFTTFSGDLIDSVFITGDFFSTSEDIGLIESALRFKKAERGEILKNIREIWKEDLIWGVNPEDLTEAILSSRTL
ncbi:hypothetical protein KKB18_12360 [bacterium]|nr:hypothetical protein [bacterium]